MSLRYSKQLNSDVITFPEPRLFIINSDGKVRTVFKDLNLDYIPAGQEIYGNEFEGTAVGYWGSPNKTEILTNFLTANKINATYKFAFLPHDPNKPRPYWNQPLGSSINHKRYNACADNRDCNLGQPNHIGKCVNYTCEFIPQGIPFNRGDINVDGAINLSDAIYLLQGLFLGGPPPSCQDAADVNDDGAVNLSDPIYLLNALFLGGPQPPAPYQQCGADLTPDTLTCVIFPKEKCP